MGVKKKRNRESVDKDARDFARRYPDLERSLMFYENRLKTFKKWKYGDRSVCDKASMAEAGFYCLGNDSAKCYYCCKELVGWEDSDVPMEEHAKHAPMCPLVKLATSHGTRALSLGQAVDLEVSRINLIFDRDYQLFCQQIRDQNIKSRSHQYYSILSLIKS